MRVIGMQRNKKSAQNAPCKLKKDGGESFGMLFPPIKYFKEK